MHLNNQRSQELYEDAAMRAHMTRQTVHPPGDTSRWKRPIKYSSSDKSRIPHLNLACKAGEGPPEAYDIELSKLPMVFAMPEPEDFPKEFESYSFRKSPYSCARQEQHAQSLPSSCQRSGVKHKLDRNEVFSEEKVSHATKPTFQWNRGHNNNDLCLDVSALADAMSEFDMESILGGGQSDVQMQCGTVLQSDVQSQFESNSALDVLSNVDIQSQFAD